MREVHLVVPDGIDDPRRPSGGNVYDQRACRGLADHGWSVHEQRAPGAWPHPEPSHRTQLAASLAELPDASVVLIDGLIASAVPEVLQPEAERLRLVVLVHMPLDEPQELPALSAARAIVVTSHWTRRWLHERYGLAWDDLHVVEPGVDAAEPAVGTSSGGRLICVGAVSPIKGHDLLLDALAQIADVAWSCVCVGALDIDEAFVAEVLRRREDAGLTERVTFTGPRTGAELEHAYAQADVLVLASRAETYGMVVTEALARGLPVIAAEVGGVPDALGHAADGSRPGVLVAPQDSGALADALRGWLGDAPERERLRAAARSRSATLRSWAQSSAALSAVLAPLARSDR